CIVETVPSIQLRSSQYCHSIRLLIDYAVVQVESTELEVLADGQFQKVQVSFLSRQDVSSTQYIVVRIWYFFKISIIVDQEIFKLTIETQLIIGILEGKVLGLDLFKIQVFLFPRMVGEVCILEYHLWRLILRISTDP